MSYHCQYAKSGRGKCKRFKTSIAKGDLKVGREVMGQQDEPWLQWFSVKGFKDAMISARSHTIDTVSRLQFGCVYKCVIQSP
jgi:hypothetical protein